MMKRPRRPCAGSVVPSRLLPPQLGFFDPTGAFTLADWRQLQEMRAEMLRIMTEVLNGKDAREMTPRLWYQFQQRLRAWKPEFRYVAGFLQGTSDKFMYATGLASLMMVGTVYINLLTPEVQAREYLRLVDNFDPACEDCITIVDVIADRPPGVQEQNLSNRYFKPRFISPPPAEAAVTPNPTVVIGDQPTPVIAPTVTPAVTPLPAPPARLTPGRGRYVGGNTIGSATASL